ncbi:MAG: hypothetical protein OES47_05115 [Acidobacteriota bacterium]|nr:hypothetical protein [Acidobacteriota bacterium]
MELPTQVLIHNQILGVKGAKGALLSVSGHGYYEVNLRFGEGFHRVLLPIGGTVVIASEAEEAGDESIELER